LSKLLKKIKILGAMDITKLYSRRLFSPMPSMFQQVMSGQG
jgi:hypothetical protein